MTYIIGEACIDVKDISCQSVCPVDCIHEADRMLVIDAEECIDRWRLRGTGVPRRRDPLREDADPPEWEPFVKINRAFNQGILAVNELVTAYLRSPTDRPRSGGQRGPGPTPGVTRGQR